MKRIFGRHRRDWKDNIEKDVEQMMLLLQIAVGCPIIIIIIINFYAFILCGIILHNNYRYSVGFGSKTDV